MNIKLSGPDKEFIPSILFGNRLTQNPIYYTNHMGYLTFNNDFNQPITDKIISIIKTNKNIQFGYKFNQPVDSLPDTIERLFFDYLFNQPINNLPNGIKCLRLGSEFNHPLVNLPESLISIEYNSKYDLDLNTLPINLKRLIIFDSNYDSDFNSNTLPSNLEYLSLPDKYNKKLENLPSSLKILKLGREFNQSIDNLQLNLQLNLQSNLQLNLQSISNNILSNLETIIFTDESKFNQPINYLGPNLKVLILGNKFSQELNCLPKGLKVLRLGHEYNYPLDNLPNGLDELVIDSKVFNHKLNNLPDNLTKLYFNSASIFSHKLENLPENLEHLKLNYRYTHELNNLPNKLKSLVISDVNTRCAGIVVPFFRPTYTYAGNFIDNLTSELEYLEIDLDIRIIEEFLKQNEHKINPNLIIRHSNKIYTRNINHSYISKLDELKKNISKISDSVFKIELTYGNYLMMLPCYNYVPNIDSYLHDEHITDCFNPKDIIVKEFVYTSQVNN